MKRKALSILGIALAVMLVAAGALQAQGNRSVFSWVVADRVTVQGGGISVAGDVAFGDDLTLTDDATMGGDLVLTAQTAITVTNGATLTPTGVNQPIRSAGTVGFGAITAGGAGQMLVLTNQTNTTITITDTGTLKLGGNAALGQYDSLTLISDGTNWIQLSKADN